MDIIFPLITVFLEQCAHLENSLLFRTENVCGISKHIFTPNGGYCLTYSFGKILHTEFADLVDTLTTQLKPTAAEIKNSLSCTYFQVLFSQSNYFKFMIQSTNKRHISKNAFVVGFYSLQTGSPNGFFAFK